MIFIFFNHKKSCLQNTVNTLYCYFITPSGGDVALKPNVSIVMPAYNAEELIRRSIESVLSQSLQEIEFIIINDGSTDKTGEICNNYAKKDPRVRVFHKENGGVAAARELGMSHVSGEYYTHVDADDWIEPDMLKILYEKATEDNVDMVICGYYTEYETHKTEFFIEEASDAMAYLEGVVNHYKPNPALWNKLVKTSLYKENNVKFFKGINFGEDMLIILQLLLANPRVSVVNQAFYHYIANPDSITGSFSRKKFNERLALIEKIQKLTNHLPNIDLSLLKLQIKLDMVRSRLYNKQELRKIYPNHLKKILTSQVRLDFKLLYLLSELGFSQLTIQLMSAKKDLKKHLTKIKGFTYLRNQILKLANLRV